MFAGRIDHWPAMYSRQTPDRFWECRMRSGRCPNVPKKGGIVQYIGFYDRWGGILFAGRIGKDKTIGMDVAPKRQQCC